MTSFRKSFSNLIMQSKSISNMNDWLVETNGSGFFFKLEEMTSSFLPM
jgi:hypothetical protein